MLIFCFFFFEVCLTVFSITSQKTKKIPLIQATDFFDAEGNSELDRNDNNITMETSTEALKYIFIPHPRRSKSVDQPQWPSHPASYNDGLVI